MLHSVLLRGRGVLLAAGLLVAGAAAAQTKKAPPIKFGQPEAADFEARNFVADSGATAVVLCDYGTSRFGSPTGEMRIIHERMVRLKILKKAGYDYATVEVPLYHRDNDAEKLSDLRGFTYVRGADGKVVKTKLEASSIFLEKRTDRVSVQKFTLPAVQEGAVVEYAYTVTSSFLTDCPDWAFQRDIPTRWSEYRVSIPRFYHYKMLYSGYVPLEVNEEGSGSVALSLTQRAGDGAGAGANLDLGTSHLTVNTEDHRWAVHNAPAVRPEAYITTPSDYVAGVSLELVGEQWPEQQYRDLLDSWVKKNHVLNEHEEFGLALKRTDFLREAVQPLVLQTPRPGRPRCRRARPGAAASEIRRHQPPAGQQPPEAHLGAAPRQLGRCEPAAGGSPAPGGAGGPAGAAEHPRPRPRQPGVPAARPVQLRAGAGGAPRRPRPAARRHRADATRRGIAPALPQ